MYARRQVIIQRALMSASIVASSSHCEVLNFSLDRDRGDPESSCTACRDQDLVIARGMTVALLTQVAASTWLEMISVHRQACVLDLWPCI